MQVVEETPRHDQELAPVPLHKTVEKNCTKLGPVDQALQCNLDPRREFFSHRLITITKHGSDFLSFI